MLDGDIRAHILSFLVEGGRERYITQRKYADRLLNYIEERDPTVLRALVDHRVRRRSNQLCWESFLRDFANGEPVIHAIKSMLKQRYPDATSNRYNFRPRKMARRGNN